MAGSGTLNGLLKPMANPAILAAVCGGLMLLYVVTKIIYNLYFHPLSAYPGPKLWAISMIPSVIPLVRGNDAMAHIALHDRYGPIVRTAPNRLSFASGAQTWRDIYGFRKAGKPQPAKDKLFYGKSLNGAPSVATADDAGHTRQRKILSHSFSDKALKEQEPLLKKWAVRLAARMEEDGGKGEEIDLLKLYNCTTFDVMGELTFSEPLCMLENSELIPWVKAIFAGIKVFVFFFGVKQISPVINWLIENILVKSKLGREKQFEHASFCRERVNRRMDKIPEHPDLWSRILAKDEKSGGLSLLEHQSNANVFMTAGTETTATALAGTTYHLCRNPDMLRRLSDEIRTAFPTSATITLEDLAGLKYLAAVLHEGLRMYPPVPGWLPRVVPAEGATICGEWLPPGVKVSGHHLATYRSEAFFKDAYSFRPERWLGDEEFKDDQLDAWEPFSVGPRNCLGKNLAWHEMRVLLANTLLHFDLSLSEKSQDWSDQKVFLLWEKKPLWVTLKKVTA